jgi:hypothetical protein
VFSLFGCGVSDSRMKILIYVEKTRYGGRVRMYGSRKADQQSSPSGKIGSSGRIRTYDQSVNSRPLYH